MALSGLWNRFSSMVSNHPGSLRMSSSGTSSVNANYHYSPSPQHHTPIKNRIISHLFPRWLCSSRWLLVQMRLQLLKCLSATVRTLASLKLGEGLSYGWFVKQYKYSTATFQSVFIQIHFHRTCLLITRKGTGVLWKCRAEGDDSRWKLANPSAPLLPLHASHQQHV